MDYNKLPTDKWQSLVGDHIVARREALYGPSRRAAARRTGIGESLWRQTEAGVRTVDSGIIISSRPDAATCERLAAALDWPVDFVDRLVNGELPTSLVVVDEEGTA